MAVSQTQQLPPQYVEDLQKDYGKQLTATTAAPLDTSKFAPQVAGQDTLQQQAAAMAGTQGQGIGAFSPYVTQAGAYDTGAANYGTAAAGYSGPQAYQQFNSPYQQDIIDATLSEYDTQASKGLMGIGQQAAMSGNLGGGREGVMRSEYQNKSDLNRALLQSGMLQQGFTQSNQLANQAFGQQMNLGNQQMGLSQNQQGLAGLVPSLYQGDISTLGSVGGAQQSQAQAQLDATREGNRLEAYEPYERLGYQGQGIASIASGAPGQYQSSVQPNPTPFQNALSVGSIMGGIYGNRNPYQYGQ